MTVLWDVDTQVDFMLPDGKLYVRGAEQTVPAMQRLVEAARAAGIVHVASADDHELTDAEIADEPDFRTTYPPHCLRGTRGARKIPVALFVEAVGDGFDGAGQEIVVIGDGEGEAGFYCTELS